MFGILPAWEGLHPAVVHFPIALLLVVPLFILAGLLSARHRRQTWSCGLVLCILGTLGAILATATGEASAEALALPKELRVFVDVHEEAGELTRTVFVVLAVLYVALLTIEIYGQKLFKRPPSQQLLTRLMAAYFAIYVGGCAVLVNTASLGGELVHLHGIRAPLKQSSLMSNDSAKQKEEENPKTRDNDKH